MKFIGMQSFSNSSNILHKTLVAASLECVLQPGKVFRAGISKNMRNSP